MKIGVISDTHIEDLAAGLEFLDHLCTGPFAEVDLILHAGDIGHPDLLQCFTDKAIIAVRGNCDSATSTLPQRRICEADGFTIGLTHGWGGAAGIVDHVLSSFKDVALDALVFGHSHYPLCRHNGDLLLFNPGSATDRRDAPYHSVGILTLTDTLQGHILNIDSLLSAKTFYNEVRL